MLGDFADVQEAVRAGEEFDEGAELRQANDFTEIGFADFGAGGDVANHLQGRVAAGSAGGEDVHGAVFEDVDLDAGGFDDGPDLLAARPDKVADFAVRDSLSVFSMVSRIWRRAFFACARASRIMPMEMPRTLISICSAVMPARVPATLKSMSP
jgi:hypothetical protein